MNLRKPGFTLVELLVVISVIGVLMGLALPALQGVVSHARLASCKNNMGEIAKATDQFVLRTGRYPSSLESFGRHINGIDPSDPQNRPPPHMKIGSWGVALLPYLDQSPAYERWSDDAYPLLTTSRDRQVPGELYDFERLPNLSVYICPAESIKHSEPFARCSYVANVGLWTPLAGHTSSSVTDMQRQANGVFLNRYQTATAAKVAALGVAALSPDFPTGKTTREDLRDGRSQTVLFSENLLAEPWYRINFAADGNLPLGLTTWSANPQLEGWALARLLTGMVWQPYDDQGTGGAPLPAFDGPYRINGQKRNRSFTSFAQLYSMSGIDAVADFASPSSDHVGGVVMAMADGSVRFVQDSIEYVTYQSLMTPHNRKSRMPNPHHLIGDGEL